MTTLDTPPGVRYDAVSRFFAEHVPGAEGPLTFHLIGDGRSNLTYRVTNEGGSTWVMRRPPLGHVLPTAHDMVREHRVLRALEGTAVPVPRVLHLGGGDGPLGVDFYVMERVVGHVCRNALPPGYAEDRQPRAAIGAAIV